MSASGIDYYPPNIIAYDTSENKRSEYAETATVRPIFKKDDRSKIKNFRHVNLLNMFSKICERFLHENLRNYVNTFLSKFITADHTSCSTNHVLSRLTENWKKSLIDKNFVSAALMVLSKVFNSIPHDLLIAKMYSYGFSINTVFTLT